MTLVVWRPESHNKAREFTQRTRQGGGRSGRRGRRGRREEKEEVGLTDRRPGDQIGIARNCRKKPLDDPPEFTAPLE